MAKKLMIQGTMSNSGKSFLTAALCRIFSQEGYKTAPFKSQNMALNSYITEDGLEIGRAQAMQAEAAGISPTAEMNPILLKPTSQMGSQVIVMGQVYGNLRAMDYYRRKPDFIPVIQEAFRQLEEEYEVIILEGAGSPAEINLRENDIVNMGMAQMADAPVLLVGDIDRGGVFASLYGTVSLLEPEERARIKGLVINKFRGDVEILKSGLKMIQERLKIPVVGVIPMEQIDLDDEDSLAERLEMGPMPGAGDREQVLDIAVIRLPHLSNFTDFNALEQIAGAAVRYVDRASFLGTPDLVILPGTKNTMEDLTWLRQRGLEPAILRLVEEKQIPLIGICGGFQMLGRWLSDPEGVEGEAGSRLRGMGLFDLETVFADRKTRTRITGVMEQGFGVFEDGSFSQVQGYEIHMGVTREIEPEKETQEAESFPAFRLSDGRMDGRIRKDGLVFGTYLHGIFDNEAWTEGLLSRLAKKKGITLKSAVQSREAYQQQQYDKLAALVEKSLDMDAVRRIMGFSEKEILEAEKRRGSHNGADQMDASGAD